MACCPGRGAPRKQRLTQLTCRRETCLPAPSILVRCTCTGKRFGMFTKQRYRGYSTCCVNLQLHLAAPSSSSTFSIWLSRHLSNFSSHWRGTPRVRIVSWQYRTSPIDSAPRQPRWKQATSCISFIGSLLHNAVQLYIAFFLAASHSH